MDHEKLRHFLAVFDEGHFGRAAYRLGITQQAVSKSIAKLESSLNVPLFERGIYGASPTHYARSLAGRAKLILAEAEIAKVEIDAIRGGRKGHIRVGVGLSFATKVVPKALERFRRTHPGFGVTSIVGSSGQLYRMLLNGEFDLVVSAPVDSVLPDIEIHREILFTETDVPVVGCRHPLAAREEVSLADLAAYPWIVPANLPESWEKIRKTFTDAGIAPPSDVFRTDSITLARSLIDCGNFILLSLAENLNAGGLSSAIDLNTNWPVSQRTASIATLRRSRLQPAAQSLCEMVRLEVRALRSVVNKLPGVV